MTSPGSDRVDESAPEIRDREVVLNGSRVQYLRAGDGPHLVLLRVRSGQNRTAGFLLGVLPYFLLRDRVR